MRSKTTTKQMLAVVKEKTASGVAIKNIPIPKPAKGEARVKIKMASICGTDIGIYDWTPWAAGHIKPPVTIGHEIVGEVVEINDDDSSSEALTKEGAGGLKIGDLVSSETHIFCGYCYQCKIGNRHICENMELFGIGRDGGFAEYATVPLRTCWKNDPDIPLEWMSAQEPLGNAVHVVSKAGVSGKSVLIFGLGPTGLCAAAVAAAYGAKSVVGINRGKTRRDLGRKMGCDAVFEKVPESLNGTFDIVLEMSGSTEAITDSFEALRAGGKIIAFGIPKTETTFDWGKYLINKELTIESVFGRRIWETWYQSADLLKAKKVNLGKIITHRFKLDDFEKAMRVMKSGEAGKIILTP